MQLSVFKYPNINTKLKAMYSKKLKPEEFLELSKQLDFEKAILFLKSQNNNFSILSDNADRIEIEAQLDKNLIIDIQKIDRLLPQNSKKIFKTFLSKYEIQCIKSVFRKLYSGSIVDENSENLSIWTNTIFKRINGINNVNNYESFLYILRKTPYYKIFKKYENIDLKEINIFEIENRLDIAYFSEMMNLAIKTKNKQLQDIIGTTIDLQNITWIYRTKKYFRLSDEDVEKTLINFYYKISKKNIKKLIKVNNYLEFESIVKNTVYKKLVETDEKYIEQIAEKILYDKSKMYFRTELFNINFVLAYIDIIDAENNDIKNIIEGIRYNIKREEVLKKLVVNINL